MSWDFQPKNFTSLYKISRHKKSHLSMAFQVS
jgi:hypothetical protein